MVEVGGNFGCRLENKPSRCHSWMWNLKTFSLQDTVIVD
jgi:hypothetical protein